jgi:SPP1 family phage portal protein
MELQEILDLIESPKKLVEKIKSTKSSDFKGNYDLWVKQWNTKDHAVITDKIARPDKQLDDGRTVKLVRIPVPFQKLIVRRAASFLCGNPIEIDAKAVQQAEKDFLGIIRKTWDDNKLDYASKKLARLMMAETECAELWFLVDAKEGYWKGTPNEKGKNVTQRMRMKILANRFGDSLYPVFDKYGDMVAFARGYVIENGKDKTEHFDIYTDKRRYLLTNQKTGWTIDKNEEEPTRKIPIIYYSQENVEWVDVQWLIERVELVISKLGDTNDYFGHPVLALEAQDANDVDWPDKDQSGKAVLLKNGAKAGYITWQFSPESVKTELINLRSLIMDMTDTPDISFDQVKGLGSYSGIALKMIFMGAHMKAAEKEEIFGESVQRRLNFMKAANAIINTAWGGVVTLSMKPRFTFYVPKDTTEETNMLINAMGADKPLISQETAVDLCSFIEDKDGEKERLKKEADDAAAKVAEQQNSPTSLDKLMNAVA